MNLLRKSMSALLGFCLSATLSAQQFHYEGISYEVIPEEHSAVRVFRVNRCMHSFVVPSTVPDYSGAAYRVTRIGNNGFRSACSLVNIDLNGVKILEDGFVKHYNDGAYSEYYGAFRGCRELEKVILPQVVRVGDYGFYECEKLSHMEFGPYLTSIGKEAFGRTENLKVLKMSAVVPPTCAPDAFSEKIYQQTVLQVPEGKKSLYEQTEVWKLFERIEETGATTAISVAENPIRLSVKAKQGQILIEGLGGGEIVTVYTIDGRLITKTMAKAKSLQVSVSEGEFYVVTVEGKNWKVKA